MINFWLLVFFIIETSLYAQVKSLDKIVITPDEGAIFIDNRDEISTQLGLFWGSPMEKKCAIYGSPINGLFKDTPLFWDVADSFLFKIDLHTDGTFMTFASIKRYDIKQLMRYSGSALNNYILNKTLIDNDIWPLEFYTRRIHFREDSLEGPIYFDCHISQDSFLLYLYLQDKHKIEVWNYIPFPFVARKQKASAVRQASKKWEQIFTIPVVLNGPFRIINTHGKQYLISYTGDILWLNHSKVQKNGQLPEHIQNGILVVDKSRDEVYYAEKSVFLKEGGMPWEGRASASVVRILEGDK